MASQLENPWVLVVEFSRVREQPPESRKPLPTKQQVSFLTYEPLARAHGRKWSVCCTRRRRARVFRHSARYDAPDRSMGCQRFSRPKAGALTVGFDASQSHSGNPDQFFPSVGAQPSLPAVLAAIVRSAETGIMHSVNPQLRQTTRAGKTNVDGAASPISPGT